MRNMAAKFIDLSLSSLDRRPMLTAMMVYSVGIGVAAVIVAFALWRETSCSPNPQKFHATYMVWIAPNIRIDPRGLNANIVLDQPARPTALMA